MRATESKVEQDERKPYLDAFPGFLKARVGKEPAWLSALRKEAIRRFEEIGFPTVDEEEWRHTSISPLTKIPFRPVGHEDYPPLPPLGGEGKKKVHRHTLAGGERRDEGGKDMEWVGFHALHAIQLVFVDGRFSPEFSTSPADPAWPKGLTAGGLADAIREGRPQVREYFSQKPGYGKTAFTALNTAFFVDGAFVHIAEDAMLPHPLHLLFVSTAQNPSVVSYPRNLIFADANSQATVMETYVGLGSGPYFSDPWTDIVVGENAVLDHYKLQRENLDAFHVATVDLRQGSNSQVRSCSIALGARLSRNNITALLNAQGADLALNGLYVTQGEQLADSHTWIDHAKPHCNSRELYLGLLDGQSRGVFDGKIFVQKDAQKTNASQTNKNLLLSEQALVNTKPQLEIYADDVKCTHGATIGQLEEDALFYLCSRGVSRQEARSILIYAFANQVADRIKVDALRIWLEGVLVSRFRGDHEGRG